MTLSSLPVDPTAYAQCAWGALCLGISWQDCIVMRGGGEMCADVSIIDPVAESLLDSFQVAEHGKRHSSTCLHAHLTATTQPSLRSPVLLLMCAPRHQMRVAAHVQQAPFRLFQTLSPSEPWMSFWCQNVWHVDLSSQVQHICKAPDVKHPRLC